MTFRCLGPLRRSHGVSPSLTILPKLFDGWKHSIISKLWRNNRNHSSSYDSLPQLHMVLRKYFIERMYYIARFTVIQLSFQLNPPDANFHSWWFYRLDWYIIRLHWFHIIIEYSLILLSLLLLLLKIYVWLDALTNYLTVGGYPAVVPSLDCHVIGKDINK